MRKISLYFVLFIYALCFFSSCLINPDARENPSDNETPSTEIKYPDLVDGWFRDSLLHIFSSIGSGRLDIAIEIRNQGNADCIAYKVLILLSKDKKISFSDDFFLKEIDSDEKIPAKDYTVIKDNNVPLPSLPPGDYYVGYVVICFIPEEQNTSNNWGLIGDGIVHIY